METGGEHTGQPRTAGNPAFEGALVKVEETFVKAVDVEQSRTKRF